MAAKMDRVSNVFDPFDDVYPAGHYKFHGYPMVRVSLDGPALVAFVLGDLGHVSTSAS
jgi:hypothetical protein